MVLVSGGISAPISRETVRLVSGIRGFTVHPRRGKNHLGELPAHENGAALLVAGLELRHHVVPVAPLVLVDDPAARAHAHAGAQRLDELELYLRMQPRGDDVAGMAH